MTLYLGKLLILAVPFSVFYRQAKFAFKSTFVFIFWPIFPISIVEKTVLFCAMREGTKPSLTFNIRYIRRFSLSFKL